MPRYSVIAADTLRDLVTLTFGLLTLVSGHTCRRFDTIPACDGRTDRQTDGQTDGQTVGIAVANTALAIRALRAL